MNKNKYILDEQIQTKQQQSLKCLQFATEYLLKLNQYRLLNPFLLGNQLDDINRIVDSMDQLNQYSYGRRNQVVGMKKIDQQTGLNEQMKMEEKRKSKKQDEQQEFKEMGQVEKNDEEVNKSGLQNQIEKSQSFISSKSSMKSKRKFQQPQKTLNKQINNKIDNPAFPQFNFKKKKSTNQPSSNHYYDQLTQQKQYQQRQSPQKQQEKQEDEDSFDNFPLGSNIQSTEQLILKQQLCQSYHSSVRYEVGDKFKIDTVSQHNSENQMSDIIGLGQFNKISKIRSQKEQKEQQSNSSQQEYNDSMDEFNDSNNQNKSNQQSFNSDLSSVNTEDRGNFLMKLQTFGVQQQILFKKIHKIWNNQFQSLQNLRSLKFSDFNLPKPVYKLRSFQFANVIQ